MTLTEFLLARIAEDERLARGTIAYGTERYGECYPAQVMSFDVNGASGDDGWLTVDPERMLAECAKNRRIIAFLDEWHEWDEPYLLAMLALPYVDHPEYRAEWAPEQAVDGRQ